MDEISKLEKRAKRLMKPGCMESIDYNLREAAEMYEKAAKLLKLNEHDSLAIDDFNLAADLFIQGGNILSAAGAYKEISSIYRKAKDVDKFIDTNKIIVDLYLNEARLSDALKYSMETAEFVDDNNRPSLDYWKLSLKLAKSCDKSYSLSKCYARVADGLAINGDIESAMAHYKELLDNKTNYMKFSREVEECAIKIIMCNLTIPDVIAAKKALYSIDRIAICGNKSSLDDMIMSVRDSSKEDFISAYNSLGKYDPWYEKIKSIILSKIKEDDSDGIL